MKVEVKNSRNHPIVNQLCSQMMSGSIFNRSNIKYQSSDNKRKQNHSYSRKIELNNSNSRKIELNSSKRFELNDTSSKKIELNNSGSKRME